MRRPFAGFGESLLVCRCEWFVVDGSVRNCTGDGIEQTFEHANRGGHLVRGKVLDQFVGVLFVCRHNRAILHRDDLAENIDRIVENYGKPHCLFERVLCFESHNSGSILKVCQ